MQKLISTAKHYMPSAAAYFVVGGSCALIEWAVFYVSHDRLGWHYLAGGFAGFLVATFANWLLSARFVFRNAGRSRGEEAALVYAVSGIGFGINLAVMTAAIELFGIPTMLAKIGGTGVAFIWNYVARQFFVFDRRRHRLDPMIEADADAMPAGAVSETSNI